jgi:hypothetical protein
MQNRDKEYEPIKISQLSFNDESFEKVRGNQSFLLSN